MGFKSFLVTVGKKETDLTPEICLLTFLLLLHLESNVGSFF